MFDHFPGLDWPTPYGLMLALAGAAAWWFARRRAVAYGLDPSHVDFALPLAFAGGAVANLLIAAAVPQERLLAGEATVAEEFLRMPTLIPLALLALFAYCRVAVVPARRCADVVVPAAVLASAIGYLGCYLAGCCFGAVVGNARQIADLPDPPLRLQAQTLAALSPEGLPWAVRFPPGSVAYGWQLALGLIAPGAVSTLPVHPVQLYEAAAALLLFVGLLRLQPWFRRDGSLALAAFAGYAVLAFGLQFLRADSALVLGPLTATQLVYGGWLVAAMVLALISRSDARAALGGDGAWRPSFDR